MTTSSGSDDLGPFHQTTLTHNTAGVALAVKAYGQDTFVLEQRLLSAEEGGQGCPDTEGSPLPPLPAKHVNGHDSSFPGMVPPFIRAIRAVAQPTGELGLVFAILLHSFPAWASTKGLLQQLRYITWQGGDHAVYQWTVQESHGVDITAPKDDGTFMGLAGLSSGPVVLMKAQGASSAGTAALAIGPLTNFKLATSVMTRSGQPISSKDPLSSSDTMAAWATHLASRNATWELGVSAEIRSAPAGFVHRTLITSAA
eukprot:gene3478-3941_t